MSEKIDHPVVVNEDVNDLIEEAYHTMMELLPIGDFLDDKGYSQIMDRLERSTEQLRRWLYTPDELRVNVYSTTYESPRYWVDDNIHYVILFEGQPSKYVGLVDEEAGGHIAYGVYENISALIARLNLYDAYLEMVTDPTKTKGRHERRVR